ncbi:hypothetical protein [Mesorhizobium sp.]|uniref:hypothetical protein n=1 Tax=Mesorhizobium sp. TaxID=1871066 RepID=UPI0025EAB282|nr:hypothetical protein [Mesorhizobium sp.]
MAATWRIRAPFFALRTAFFLAVAIPKSDESGIRPARHARTAKTLPLQTPKPSSLQSGILPASKSAK